jgi:hypothetical protein
MTSENEQAALDLYVGDASERVRRTGEQRSQLADPDSSAEVIEVITSFVAGARFTSDDVRGRHRKAGPRVLGSAIRAAANAGLIFEVGSAKARLVSSHSRRVLVWERTTKGLPP